METSPQLQTVVESLAMSLMGVGMAIAKHIEEKYEPVE